MVFSRPDWESLREPVPVLFNGVLLQVEGGELHNRAGQKLGWACGGEINRRRSIVREGLVCTVVDMPKRALRRNKEDKFHSTTGSRLHWS